MRLQRKASPEDKKKTTHIWHNSKEVPGEWLVDYRDCWKSKLGRVVGVEGRIFSGENEGKVGLLSYFPIAAVTNYNKLSGLKQ